MSFSSDRPLRILSFAFLVDRHDRLRGAAVEAIQGVLRGPKTHAVLPPLHRLLDDAQGERLQGPERIPVGEPRPAGTRFGAVNPRVPGEERASPVLFALVCLSYHRSPPCHPTLHPACLTVPPTGIPLSFPAVCVPPISVL